MARRLAAMLAATTLAILVAAPVLAGGWAEIVIDPATTKASPPVEGQDLDIGFTVLQHGETPAPWVTATVRFTDLQTGGQYEVVAENTGPDGHFALTTQIPSAGFWTWTVFLTDLMNEPVATPLVVHTADGRPPTLDPTFVLTAIDTAQRRAIGEANGVTFTQLERVNEQIATQRAISDRLAEQVAALEASGAASEAPAGGLPVLALVTLAVLAGATSGFAMAWLAGRPRPRPMEVGLSRAPREADPA